jgi:hypothetical protein
MRSFTFQSKPFRPSKRPRRAGLLDYTEAAELGIDDLEHGFVVGKELFFLLPRFCFHSAC